VSLLQASAQTFSRFGNSSVVHSPISPVDEEAMADVMLVCSYLTLFCLVMTRKSFSELNLPNTHRFDIIQVFIANIFEHAKIAVVIEKQCNLAIAEVKFCLDGNVE